ncbi:glycoside hydrolase domain-containing protein [Bacillus taeanensis]|uniref:Rv2525c-like glycoside hydrolase-like domain-containing protein n=1 Tax=Bacillus taeanensis TaxID=273032 RepID=A0A366XZ07_9BACI|nr:glycoside hydrolase domain-containing protein [Bacillus taeanensis]RBW69161.1 hypothetical protein DS031_13030 [Bacillus taeanensis]
MARKLWGVDSAAAVTDDLYNCVVKNYGKPSYWGRYLTTVENVSDGLTKEEIRLLHNRGVKVLPIYNVFKEAVGYEKGKIAALNTLFHARRLGFPKDVYLFANVEKFFNVDEGWIRGWVDGIYPSGYRPGIYSDPSQESFNRAYCLAVSNSDKVGKQVVLWSQEPTPGVSKASKAPDYKPMSPPCTVNVWAWQYGENAPECPIDTNLMDQRLYNKLY